MTSTITRLLYAVASAVLLVSCGGASGSQAPARGGEGAPTTPRTLKRITAAIYGQPTSVVNRMNSAQVSIPGASAIEQLVTSGLTEIDAEGKYTPSLAEAVPSLENGLWTLLPDGRMSTTWRLKPNARWQDGTPVTAQDLVFTTTVDQDKDLPILRPTAYQSVESVEAIDARTVTVWWSKPYIDADTMFSSAGTSGFAVPIPRHKLEEAYLSDKAGFMGLSFWNADFVGNGAFKVKDFLPGSSVTLAANDGYVFGRPKIDEIEVRFILDLNTITTNLVAGSVDMTLGRGFSIEAALHLRDQWRDGSMIVTPRSWIVMHPQFMNPSPPVMGSVDFRRALMHATDRQQLMDSLQGGLTGVAHVYLNPSEPEYKEVESAVIRYEYEPRKALQMIEGLGFSKGPDGLLRDAASQKLELELRTYGVKVSDTATVTISDAWKSLGLSTEPVIVPPQRITDREYMASFPGLLMYRQPNAAGDLSRLRSNLAPTAETRFVGSNYARYVNPEFDSLIDTYLTTIPRGERIAVLRQAVHHISDQLNLMGLFYDAEISLLNNRLKDITARETRLWNIQGWDLKS